MSVTLLQFDYVTRKKNSLTHFDYSVCLLFFELFKLLSKGHVEIFDVTHTLLFITVLLLFEFCSLRWPFVVFSFYRDTNFARGVCRSVM